MSVLKAIRSRRAIRSYRPDPVDRATITELIDLAVCAPSGLNRQPWSFAVIEGRDRLASFEAPARTALFDEAAANPGSPLAAVVGQLRELLEGGFLIFHGAPAAVLMLAPEGDKMALLDTALAAQNLMLAAEELGLATCPVGLSGAYFNRPSTRAELGLPADAEVVLTILLGHPDGPPPEMPARREPTIHGC